MGVSENERSTAKSYGRFDGENYSIRSPIGFRGTSGRKQDDGFVR